MDKISKNESFDQPSLQLCRILESDRYMPNSKQSPDRTGHVLLASLQQSQDLQMTSEVSGGNVKYLRGPVDMVKWKQLHIVLGAIKAAIVRAAIVPAEFIECEPFLLETTAGWNPGLELWVDATNSHALDREKFNVVVELILSGLKRDAENNAGDLCAMELDATERTAVQQVIAETLGANGGMTMAEPVHVCLGQRALVFDGRLGGKPSQANFHPVEDTIDGRFIGFDVQKNELLFLTPEKRVEINFKPTLVDLLEVARAASEARHCSLRTHKTIGRNGREDHAYLPDEPFKTMLEQTVNLVQSD